MDGSERFEGEKERQYSMVQECTDLYHVVELGDGRTRIDMVIPNRFRDLWLTKLSALRTSDEEIERYEEG